jgi:hypothetical protein
VLVALLLAQFVASAQSSHACTGPFNASFSAAHLVYRTELLLGGVGALVADFPRTNSSALWLASKESARIYRLGETATRERERKIRKKSIFFRFFSRFSVFSPDFSHRSGRSGFARARRRFVEIRVGADQCAAVSLAEAAHDAERRR